MPVLDGTNIKMFKKELVAKVQKPAYNRAINNIFRPMMISKQNLLSSFR
jgi:hypothetical protein